MADEEKQGLPVLPFATQAEWEAWLDRYHASSDGLWLKLAKKASGIASINYEQAVEAALCYGWIDSQKVGYDDTYWLQRFTPRRPGSNWSQKNRRKAEELIEQGRMQPAGLREVQAAQANGRWEAAYTWQDSMAVPEDLQRALDENPAAKAFFETLDSANRYAILHRITTVKRPETRQRNIARFVDMLAAGEKLYP